jgi:hypothetical protein
MEIVKRLRATSPSLEGPSSATASPRVTAEALHLALDAASADSPGATRQQSSGSAFEHSR